MRPIHQICLDMEHVFLAKAYNAVRQFCEPRDISAFVTDALICHPSKSQRQCLEEARLSITQPLGQTCVEFVRREVLSSA